VALLALELQSGTGRGRVNDFAGSRAAKRRPEFPVELGQLGSPSRVVLFQKPQRFPDDLARRVVAARIHFGADEFSSSGVSETFMSPV